MNKRKKEQKLSLTPTRQNDDSSESRLYQTNILKSKATKKVDLPLNLQKMIEPDKFSNNNNQNNPYQQYKHKQSVLLKKKEIDQSVSQKSNSVYTINATNQDIRTTSRTNVTPSRQNNGYGGVSISQYSTLTQNNEANFQGDATLNREVSNAQKSKKFDRLMISMKNNSEYWNLQQQQQQQQIQQQQNQQQQLKHPQQQPQQIKKREDSPKPQKASNTISYTSSNYQSRGILAVSRQERRATGFTNKGSFVEQKNASCEKNQQQSQAGKANIKTEESQSQQIPLVQLLQRQPQLHHHQQQQQQLQQQQQQQTVPVVADEHHYFTTECFNNTTMATTTISFSQLPKKSQHSLCSNNEPNYQKQQQKGAGEASVTRNDLKKSKKIKKEDNMQNSSSNVNSKLKNSRIGTRPTSSSYYQYQKNPNPNPNQQNQRNQQNLQQQENQAESPFGNNNGKGKSHSTYKNSSLIAQKMNDSYLENVQLMDQSDKKRNLKNSPLLTAQDYQIDEDDLIPGQKNSKKKQVILQPNTSAIKQELRNGCKNAARLYSMEFTYFCIKTRGRFSPLQVKIHFEKPSTYKIFISRENEVPSQFSNDYIAKSHLIKLEARDRVKFEDQQHFFFALVSSEDQFIYISFYFSDGESGNKKYGTNSFNQSKHMQLQQQYQTELYNNNSQWKAPYKNDIIARRSLSPSPMREGSTKNLRTITVTDTSSPHVNQTTSTALQQYYEDYDNGGANGSSINELKKIIRFSNKKMVQFQHALYNMPTVYLREEVREILRRRRQKAILHHSGATAFDRAGFNIIELNRQSVRQHTPDKRDTRLQFRRALAQQRQRQIQQKKADLEQFSATAKAEGFFQREHEKEGRRVQKIEEIKLFKKNAMAFLWSTDIVLALLVGRLYAAFQRHKERKMLISRMAFSLLRIFQRYKVKVRNAQNLTLYQRVQKDVQQVARTYAHALKRKTRKQAQKVMVYLLQQSQEGSYLRNRMVKFYRVVYGVQMNYKTYNLKAFNYRHLLRELWHKYFYMVIEQVIEIKYDNSIRHKKIIMRYNQEDVVENYVEKFFQERLRIYRKKLQDYLQYIRGLDDNMKKNAKITEVFLHPDEEEDSNELYKKLLLKRRKNKNKPNGKQLGEAEEGEDTPASPSPFSRQVKDFQLAIKTDNNTSEFNPNNYNYNNNNNQNEQEPLSSQIRKLPRLYTIPTFQQIKDLIYQTVVWKNQQDPDLAEITKLKY